MEGQLTVGELRALLSKYPRDMLVFTAKDDEGNGYNRAMFVPTVMYLDKWDADRYNVESMFCEEDIEEQGLDIEQIIKVVVI